MNTRQHAKILGFALIAYGLQFLFGAISSMGTVINEIFNPYASNTFIKFLYLTFDSHFYPLIYFTIAVISGIVIIVSKKRAKFFSLLFVFLTITFFPLGTILSFYTLCYLFIISEIKSDTEQNLSKETE